jgi:diaminobutyrate-2-oxoglutarate transaminase
MLRRYWADNQLEKQTLIRADHIEQALREIQRENPAHPVKIRGRGAIWGIDLAEGPVAKAVSARAFELGLLVETSGPRGEVVKLLPALTSTSEELETGLELLARAVRETVQRS